MLPRTIFFVFSFLFSLLSVAQTYKLSGTVYDAHTKTPLAFVSITIKGTNRGVVTDIDGRFSIEQIETHSVLYISYIGYQNIEYQVEKNRLTELQIFIEPADNQLETVTISSTENPANRIIKALQRNRKRNDPESQSSFKYNAYTIAALASDNHFWNMSKVDLSKRKREPVKKLSENIKDTNNSKTLPEIVQRFKENYLLVTESYTERIFRHPNQSKETVLATKVSGLKSASFSITTRNFQPFGFYKDYLEMNNSIYTSPVIEGSIDLYKFRLMDAIPHEKDTTFIISFEPRNGKNFKGLKGMIYINSNGYAIENVIASPADEKGLIFTFKLQQKYERVMGTWFPAQFNTIISQKDITTDSVMLYWDSRSYITNVTIGNSLSSSDFSDVQMEFHPMAGNRHDTAWNRLRIDSLSKKSKMTYKTFEMLPPKYKNTIEKINKTFQILSLEAFQKGKIDIPFKYFLSGINKYERFRLGAGFQTNSLFSKWISVGGFGGYGLGDKAWKYGANLLLTFHHRTNTSLRFNYRRDLIEPGYVDYFLNNGSIFSNQLFRNFLISRMDSLKQIKIEFGTNIRPFIQSNIWLLHELRNPAGYNYQFNDANKQYRNFHITEIGIGFRFTRGESFTQMGNYKIRTMPATTQLIVQLSKSINTIFNNDFNYTKAAIQLNHSFRLKKFGKTSFQFEAEQIWGNVPYSYLFNIKATNSGKLAKYKYIPFNFQTVGLYEFVSSRTSSLFIEHNFGSLLFKPHNIYVRPELVFIQSISYGNLNNATVHKYIDIKVPKKGLFESGLMIKNLYKKKILSVAYAGLGGGFFYRYGYYALIKAINNWVFKLDLSISF